MIQDRSMVNGEALAEQVAAVCQPLTMPAGAAPAQFRVARPSFGRHIQPSFMESFRLLALQVTQWNRGLPIRTLLVMSANRGEGRTTTTANLGIALAEMGRRVVLVDMDSSKPGLVRLFPKAAAASSAPAAAPATGVGVVPTDVPGLVLLQHLPSAEGAVPLGTLETVLQALTPVADTVIVDSPPCLGTSDGFFLATRVDGVLFVVRRRKQSYEAQRGIQSRLGRLGANVLGVVYNEA